MLSALCSFQIFIVFHRKMLKVEEMQFTVTVTMANLGL